MTDDEPETVAIPREQLIEYAMFHALEYGEWKVFCPENVDDDDMMDGVSERNVEEVEVMKDGKIVMRGEFTVPEVVERIPASGGGRLEPPTNPPEVVTEERKAMFSVSYPLEEMPEAEITVEAW